MKNLLYSNNLFLSFYKWGSEKFSTPTIIILVIINSLIIGVFLSELVSVFVSFYIIFIHNMKIDIEKLKNKNIRDESNDKTMISQ